MAPERPRARSYHPLTIRGWAVGKSPEEIYETLTTRVAAIDETVQPHRKSLIVFLQRFYDEVLKTLGWMSVPVLPARVEITGRAIAWAAISFYWKAQRYEGKYLPRIVIRGYPWEVFPDEVHLLDLSQDLLVAGVRQSRPFEWIHKVVASPSSEPKAGPITEALVAMVLDTILLDGVVAWTSPLVQQVIFEVLKTAHHSPSRPEKRKAAGRLDEVFRAFFPDLSQHVSRREEALLPLLGAYEELYARVEPLHSDLQREGLTRGLVGRFRDRLRDGRIELSHLRKWQPIEARDVALELLGWRAGLRPRTLADQLTLARKARAIEEAWTGFREFWEKLPESQQFRVLPPISPYLPFSLPLPQSR